VLAPRPHESPGAQSVAEAYRKDERGTSCSDLPSPAEQSGVFFLKTFLNIIKALVRSPAAEVA
jgi:hypothetical protein